MKIFGRGKDVQPEKNENDGFEVTPDMVVNIDGIMTSDEAQHRRDLESFSLHFGCGCGKDTCEAEIDPVYSRMRVVLMYIMIMTRFDKGDYRASVEKFGEELERMSKTQLADFLMYAISRSNAIEKAWIDSKREQ